MARALRAEHYWQWFPCLSVYLDVIVSWEVTLQPGFGVFNYSFHSHSSVISLWRWCGLKPFELWRHSAGSGRGRAEPPSLSFSLHSWLPHSGYLAVYTSSAHLWEQNHSWSSLCLGRLSVNCPCTFCLPYLVIFLYLVYTNKAGILLFSQILFLILVDTYLWFL